MPPNRPGNAPSATQESFYGDVLFSAAWATGFFKDRPWFSANRCLRVVLTAGELRTSLMFPYSLFSSTHWGFRQRIPVSEIVSIRETRFLGWWPTVQVTYHDADRRLRCLEIGFTGPLPQIGRGQERKREQFVRALEAARSRQG